MADASPLAALTERRALAKTALGFAVAGVVLWLVLSFVGTVDVLATLARADPRWIVAGCVSTLVCFAAWGRAWQVVLRVGGVDVPFRKLGVTYLAAIFANYVTPLGQAGGEPFIAYVLARDTDASYEDSLASVVTADTLNLVPLFTFGIAGGAALALEASLPSGTVPLLAALAILAVAIPIAGGIAWYGRKPLGRGFLRAAAPLARRLPRASVDGLRERLRETEAAFERIAREPRALAHAMVYAYVGWAFFAFPLFAAGEAVGVPLSVLVVLFAVPASTVAGVAPSPGGTGAVAAALTGLVAVLAGVSGSTAAAIAVLYRLESYVFALLIGGAAALWVLRRT